MKITGTVTFSTPPHLVWATLTDPEALSQCMPGLQKWHIIQPDKRFQLILSWGDSANKIPIILEWTELTPPHHLKLIGQTQMGGAHIQVTGEFLLTNSQENAGQEPDTQETVLQFTAVIEAHNKFWQQIISNAAPKVAETFFNCIKQKMTSV
jgi:carbon monoxide dehydrogenase subunit G